MKHSVQYPANYSSRPYGQRSHFVRNLVIILIIVFFLPGIPQFLSSGFNVADLFAAALAYWTAHFSSLVSG